MLALIAVTFACQNAAASHEERFVFPIAPWTHLTFEGNKVGAVFYEGRVLAENEDSLLIVHSPGALGATIGWVRKDAVVPLAGAVAHFTKRIKEKPSDVWAYACRGRAWMVKRDPEIALKDFDKLVEVSPTAWAHTLRGNARRDAGEKEEAKKDYDEAIKKEAAHFDAYVNRGMLRLLEKDHAGALKDFDRAITVEPAYAAAHCQRGRANEALGEFQQARRDFDEALRLDPRHLGAWYGRGNLRASLKDHAGAIQDYTSALSLDPKFLHAAFNRGNSRLSLKEYKSAAADYDRVLSTHPSFVPALLNRAAAKQRLQDWAGAIADYDKVSSIDETNLDATIRKIWLLLTSEDKKFRRPADAVALAKNVVERGKNEPVGDHYALLAAALAADGKFSEAVRAQTRAVDLATGAKKAELQQVLGKYKEGQTVWGGG